MKRLLIAFVISLCSMVALNAQLRYHFANLEEGLQHLEADSAYFLGLSKNDVAWRARYSDATIEVLRITAREQLQPFTKEEELELSLVVDSIESLLRKVGVALTLPEEITFIKSAMGTEFGAEGYTRGTDIYLSGEWVARFIVMQKHQEGFRMMMQLIAHEIFHCLTRNNPQFRQSMYSHIGFTVMDQELEFPAELRKLLLTNPDVERIDNYAVFNIAGKERPCALVTICPKTWEEIEQFDKKANIFQYVSAALIPLDSLNTWFPISAASDFGEKVGYNTGYVIAPEECLADNFSFLVLAEPKNSWNTFKSPKLIQDILATLRQYYPAAK